MTIKQQIQSELKKVIEELGLSDLEPKVDYPADLKHGDYSSNVAMVAWKKYQVSSSKYKVFKNPLDLAQEIIKILNTKYLPAGRHGFIQNTCSRIETASPGFINFWIKNDILISSLSGLGSHKESKMPLAGKKISVEYTDPNPFKELHIGHLYSNILGESISRILEANGALVWRADYFGDVGMHVAKSIWGLGQMLEKTGLNIEKIAEKPLGERIDYLGKAYAKGSNEYEENENVKEEVTHLNKLIYIASQQMWQNEEGIIPKIDYKKDEEINEAELAEVYKLYKLGRDWSLENFEKQYVRLGTKFDGYYPESKASERGYRLVYENLKKGTFVQSEGAIIFPGEEYGLHTRVFINKLGLPTYEAKELGLAPWKYEDFQYDLSLIITGNEISDYFKVLVKALTEINPELGEKTKPILHGMVKLPEGKMSSRSGNVVTVNWLLDEAKKRVMSLVSQEVEDKDQVGEIIGVAAVKYALLKSSIGPDITFDFKDSISFEGNSGPYIQYVYARTQSVLAKAGGTIHNSQLTINTLKPEERELLCLLIKFDEVIQEAASKLAPNIICNYLFELAQAFNLFYQKCPIIKSEGQARNLRLNITAKTGEIIKSGLNLLGIQAPSKM